MKCQACSDGDCHLCGMQTWCDCDCDGSEGIYLSDDDYDGPPAMPETARITCPDCGPVIVEGDVFEGGKPSSGTCPGCGDRLYFAEPKNG